MPKKTISRAAQVSPILFAPACGAYAQTADTTADPHAGHDMSAATETAASADSPSTAAFKESASKMHQDMNAEYTGDADVDFARGMIPHHQGAIEMARIVLEHGADPEIRKLAEDIISAQESEIKMLEDWLAKHEPAN